LDAVVASHPEHLIARFSRIKRIVEPLTTLHTHVFKTKKTDLPVFTFSSTGTTREYRQHRTAELANEFLVLLRHLCGIALKIRGLSTVTLMWLRVLQQG
jgi:hypothetical protein